MSAVILVNPKYRRNVAGVLRSCAAFGVQQLYVTGSRAQDELLRGKTKPRLPREERMKAYADTDLIWYDNPFDRISGRIVAVEITENAMPLTYFQHPADAAYVFGPEDGSLNAGQKRHCTDFVIIPSGHCLNLACAVSVILADRRMKRQLLGLEPAHPALPEKRVRE